MIFYSSPLGRTADCACSSCSFTNNATSIHRDPIVPAPKPETFLRICRRQRGSIYLVPSTLVPGVALLGQKKIRVDFVHPIGWPSVVFSKTRKFSCIKSHDIPRSRENSGTFFVVRVHKIKMSHQNCLESNTRRGSVYLQRVRRALQTCRIFLYSKYLQAFPPIGVFSLVTCESILWALGGSSIPLFFYFATKH